MLKDLIKSKKKSNSIVIPVIEQQVLFSNYRERENWDYKVLHPSQICKKDFCPRAWVLGIDYDVNSQEKFNVDTLLKFAVGTTLHEMVQDILGKSGVLFGYWKCNKFCKKAPCTYFGFMPNKDWEVANKCKIAPKWKFQELPVIDEELCISGKTDGLLVHDYSKYVFEFKTMNTDQFMSLLEPLEDHRRQAFWYLDILQRNNAKLIAEYTKMLNAGYDVSKELEVIKMPYRGVIFLYMDKNTQKMREFLIMNPFVEKHTIMSTHDSEIVQMISDSKDKIRQTLELKKSGKLPDRIDLCEFSTSARAKKCPVRKYCFKEAD